LTEPETSLGDLVGRVAGDLGLLVKDHIELAKEEVVAEARQAGKGVGLIGGGAIAAWTGALLLSFAASWALALALETWLAFLIIGLIWLGAAAVMAIAGRKELSDVDLTPHQALNEIERDKQWLKEQAN
jgi:hypothetical protein